MKNRGKVSVIEKESDLGLSQYSNMPKRKRKSNLILYYVIFLTALVLTLFILSNTVFFKLTSVNIIGESIYSIEEITEVLGVNDGDNLFRLDIEEIEKRFLEKFFAVESVNIKRNLPDELDVIIEPCVKMAEVEEKGNYYILSENFKIMGEREKIPEKDVLVITGFEPQSLELGSILTSVDIYKKDILITILKAIEEIDFDDITNIKLDDRLNIILIYDNRIPIELGSSKDLEYKIKSVKSAIDEKMPEDFKGKFVMVGTMFVQMIEGEFDVTGQRSEIVIVG